MARQIRVPVPLLLLLSITLATVSAQETLGEVRSSQDSGLPYTYVLVGDLLQVTCTVNSAVGWPASCLIFTLENDTDSYKFPKEEVTIVTNTSIQLSHKIKGTMDAGEYICWIETGQDSTMVNGTQVYVQYGPSKVRNIHCEVKDWDESMTCTWEYGVEYVDFSDAEDLVPPEVSVQAYLSNSRQSSVPCGQTLSVYKGSSRCEWSGDKFMAARRYILSVVITNEITNKSKRTNFLIETRKIVKPSPVSQIRTTDVNSTCITVAWNHTRQEHRDMQFRVNISDGVSQIVDKRTTKVFCGLLPYTTYTLSVEGRPLNEGFWSEARSIRVVTAQSVPSSSFKVHNGGYHLGLCKGRRRNVTVFLKEVPPSERNGEIIGFQLLYNGTNITEHVESPTSAVVRNVACGSNLTVRIFSTTEVGHSLSNALLHVNTENPEPVPDFAVEVSDRGVDREVRVVWLNGSAYNDTDATVFWCVWDKAVLDRTCKGEIQWINTSLSDTDVDIPQLSLSGQKLMPQDYLFGIARRGQGIIWADCYFKPEAPMRAPEVREVKSVDGQLDIQWSPQSCSGRYPVHIVGYRLYFCELKDCHNGPEMVEVEGAENSYYTIRGKPGSTYNITIQAEDYNGRLSPLSPPQVKLVHEPEDGFPTWMWAIVAVFVAVFLLIIFICRQLYRSHTVKFAQDYRSPFDGAVNYRGLHTTPSSQDPIMESNLEETSCMTILTDAGDGESERFLAQPSSYTPHNVGASFPPQNVQICAASLNTVEEEAALPSRLSFPLTEWATTGAAPSCGSVTGEATQRHIPSSPLATSKGATVCEPQCSSVVGGQESDYVKRSDSPASPHVPQGDGFVSHKESTYLQLDVPSCSGSDGYGGQSCPPPPVLHDILAGCQTANPSDVSRSEDVVQPHVARLHSLVQSGEPANLQCANKPYVSRSESVMTQSGDPASLQNVNQSHVLEPHSSLNHIHGPTSLNRSCESGLGSSSSQNDYEGNLKDVNQSNVLKPDSPSVQSGDSTSLTNVKQLYIPTRGTSQSKGPASPLNTSHSYVCRPDTSVKQVARSASPQTNSQPYIPPPGKSVAQSVHVATVPTFSQPDFPRLDSIGGHNDAESSLYVPQKDSDNSLYAPQVDGQNLPDVPQMDSDNSLYAPQVDGQNLPDVPPANSDDGLYVHEEDNGSLPYVPSRNKENLPYVSRLDSENLPYVSRQDSENLPYVSQQDSENLPYVSRLDSENLPYVSRLDSENLSDVPHVDISPYVPRPGRSDHGDSVSALGSNNTGTESDDLDSMA